jgi:hypothetical protein
VKHKDRGDPKSWKGRIRTTSSISWCCDRASFRMERRPRRRQSSRRGWSNGDRVSIVMSGKFLPYKTY